jgi:DNA polymerase III delta prime subunit
MCVCLTLEDPLLHNLLALYPQAYQQGTVLMRRRAYGGNYHTLLEQEGEKEQGDQNGCQREGLVSLPMEGPATFAGQPVVLRRSAGEGLCLWFRDVASLNSVLADVHASLDADRRQAALRAERAKQDRLELAEREAEREASRPGRLYVQNGSGGWHDRGAYKVLEPSNLLGCGSLLERMTRSLKTYTQRAGLLRRLGEGGSLNYMLAGPPGTGKTSTVMTVAGAFGLDVYVIENMTPDALKAPKAALEPSAKPCILLFEDFDRWLTEEQRAMFYNAKDKVSTSQLLNSIDGVDSGARVIRFFTANNAGVVASNAALANRMSECFVFSIPSAEILRRKLDLLLTAREEEGQADEGSKPKKERQPKKYKTEDSALKQAFVNKVAAAGVVTLRPFTSYVISHMFSPDPLKEMMAHAAELVDPLRTSSAHENLM